MTLRIKYFDKEEDVVNIEGTSKCFLNKMKKELYVILEK